MPSRGRSNLDDFKKFEPTCFCHSCQTKVGGWRRVPNFWTAKQPPCCWCRHSVADCFILRFICVQVTALVVGFLTAFSCHISTLLDGHLGRRGKFVHKSIPLLCPLEKLDWTGPGIDFQFHLRGVRYTPLENGQLPLRLSAYLVEIGRLGVSLGATTVRLPTNSRLHLHASLQQWQREHPSPSRKRMKSTTRPLRIFILSLY